MDSTNSNPCLCNPALSLLPLPPVTMVFMAVEGPDQLVRRRRTFTPVVQSLLSRVVRDALRRLGGYLCRVQEGDMKFMVVFASPVTALEWCVLVQVGHLDNSELSKSLPRVIKHSLHSHLPSPSLHNGMLTGLN